MIPEAAVDNIRMTITEFLEARVSEDEAWPQRAAEAEAESNRADGMPDTTAADVLAYWAEVQEGGHHLRWTRILAECAAKRAIIGVHHRVADIYGEALGDTCTMCTETGPEAQGWPCLTIAALAAVYAGHPDYRQDWAL